MKQNHSERTVGRMKKRILVIGSANMDFVANTERLPDAGETYITEKSYRFASGGKGANTAVAASRLGADSIFCTRLGSDAYGRTLYDFYRREGVDVRHVHLDAERPTGLASIVVEDGGENRIIVYPGANACLSDEDVEAAVATYPEAMILQLEIPYDRVYQAVRLCNERSIPVVLDAGAATESFDLSGLGRLEIFSPNETETEVFTGIRPAAFDSCLAASIALKKLVDTRYVALKLGDRGCFLYDGVYTHFVDTYPVRVIDTTAAGDAFTAALTLEYFRNGKNLLDAARYACAVGALTVSKSGAAPSLPTDAETRAFLEAQSAGNAEEINIF